MKKGWKKCEKIWNRIVRKNVIQKCRKNKKNITKVKKLGNQPKIMTKQEKQW